jgi:glutaconate CoA-transferase subunit B
VFIMVRHGRRTFVETVDFVTSVGYGDGPGTRQRLGLRGRGPVLVVTDLGVLEPDPVSCELTLTRVHPGVQVADVRAATGWKLAVAEPVAVTDPPTGPELELLRELRKGAV